MGNYYNGKKILGAIVVPEVDINIENGEGKYSVVQKTGIGGAHGSSSTEPKAKSIAKGSNAVAFGVLGESIGSCTFTTGYGAKALEKGCNAFGNSIAGRTSQEWIDYYWDVENWQPRHWNGQGGIEEIGTTPTDDWENKGIAYNKQDGKYYYILGHNNCKYGQWLLNPAHAEGQNTKSKGMWTHTQGYATVADADFADASGQQTQSHGHHGHAGGYSSINNSPYGFAHGEIVKTSSQTNGQVVFGKFNKVDDTAQFIVGIGKSGASKNGFAVVDDYDNPAIKIGNTKITEEQLKRLLALLG